VHLDYLAPRYTFRQAAEAAAFPLNTLRSNYQREWFRTFGQPLAPGRGRARKLCLGDVLILAIASRLIDLGIHPLKAWNAAFLFGLVTHIKKDGPRRRPFELFDASAYETVLVWRPDRRPQVVAVSRKTKALELGELGLDAEEEAFGVCSVVLPLNPVQRTVFDKLGLSRPAELPQ
jgi:hypothetical protein